MLRLGIRAHDMDEAPFDELVQNISKKGFCCTQLALKKAISEFNVDIEAMTTGMALYTKQLFCDNKVDIAVLGCYLNLAEPDEEKLKQIYKCYEAHIRFASLAGCGMVGTETGAVNSEYRYELANHTESALEVFIKSLSHVVSYAEKMGVIVGIEPVCRHIMSDVKRTRKVLDAINSPNLAVIFDPVNILNIENYNQQDAIIEEAFDILKDEINVIHIKDFIIEDGEMKSRPLTIGNGLLNVPLIMKLAKQYKPYIHILIEDSLPEDVISSKKYIENTYYGT